MLRFAHGCLSSMNVRALTCLLAITLAAPVVLAGERKDEVEAELHRLQREISTNRLAARELGAETSVIESELMQLRAELIVAARATQNHEAAVSQLEDDLVDLTETAAAKGADLLDRRRELGMTLMALQRLAVRPPQALLVSPMDPNDIVRSGLLLRTAIPRMEHRAAALRQELADLSRLRASIGIRRGELERAGARLTAERRRVADLSDQKSALLREARGTLVDTTQRVERLVRESTDLADLLARLNEQSRADRLLEAARPKPKPTPEPELARAAPSPPPPAAPPISQAQGTLTAPAIGQIVVRYGEQNEFGSTAKGITFSTRPGAQIVAPYDGRIVFAGPFRQYGLILIIEHGEGYHSLMYGMARVDAAVGQWVLAGEPVGVTEGATGPVRPDQDSRSRLYVELRRQGQPINPLPWLAVSNKKVRG